MNIEKANNKELVPLEHYLEVYRETSPQEMSVRTGFAFDEKRQVFRVTFLGREYEITHPEFTVHPLTDPDIYSPLVSQNPAKILLLRFLLSGAASKGTGKFLTFREAPWGEVYYRQFQGRCVGRLSGTYGNRLEAFSASCDALGGKKAAGADCGYQFEVFPDYFVRFLLWAADEEFPPSAQILFSDNFPAVLHGEDLVVVCDVILGALKYMQEGF